MNHIARSVRRLRADDQGAALVEFALVVPLLMAMMCVIIDFGLALYTLNNITSAVREGARYGAVRQDITASIPAIRTRVLTYMSTIGTDTTAIKSKVSVTADTIAGVRNVRVTLTEYAYKPVTPLAPLFGMGTLTFTRSAIYRHEWQ